MNELRTTIVNNIKYVIVNCGTCNKEFLKNIHYYASQLKRSKSGKLYCSLHCSKIGHEVTEDTKSKIRSKQFGISVMSRGKPGRIIPQEVRDKIRNSKLGVPTPKDWEGMRKELNMYEGLIDTKVIPLIKPVPDGILIQNGQVIAVEIEKEPYEYGIRTKMKYYDNIKYFDKVIIIWYRDNERVGEFHKINGIWSDLIPTPAG